MEELTFNIFKEGELSADSTVKEYLTVQIEGLRKVKRKIAFDASEMIVQLKNNISKANNSAYSIFYEGEHI